MKNSLCVWLFSVWFYLPSYGQPPSESNEFEQHIRPLLAEHCYECHSSESKTLQGGLRLDTPNGILVGGDSGPSVVASKPDESLLIQAVLYHDLDSAMPPAGKLSEELIVKLELWVRSGASMPSDEQAAKVQRTIDIEAGRMHWSFVPTKPISSESIDTVELRSPTVLIENRIDLPIARKLIELDLVASAQADRRSLLRRLKLDLLGLLPSDEEVSSFVSDPAVDAYERRVDEYLASGQYGERWARYWLDLVRYCDYHGGVGRDDRPFVPLPGLGCRRLESRFALRSFRATATSSRSDTRYPG